MTVLWDQSVMVECDHCGKTITVATVPLANGGIIVDTGELEENGWDGYNDLCSDCKEKE